MCGADIPLLGVSVLRRLLWSVVATVIHELDDCFAFSMQGCPMITPHLSHNLHQRNLCKESFSDRFISLLENRDVTLPPIFRLEYNSILGDGLIKDAITK